MSCDNLSNNECIKDEFDIIPDIVCVKYNMSIKKIFYSLILPRNLDKGFSDNGISDPEK